MSNVVPLESAMPLSSYADRIRKLMTDMAKNTLAVGAELDRARGQFPVGPRNKLMGWAKWLRKEFDLGESSARQLILVHKKFGHLVTTGGAVPSVRVLRALLPNKVPEAARREVIQRHQRGEKVGSGKTKKIIRAHLPSPKKANEIARATGKPTAASDGYVYLGADPKKVSQAAERRTMVYAVREAVNCIANIKLSATDFLEYALPHQLWKASNEQEIDLAIEWLTSLRAAWGKRK